MLRSCAVLGAILALLTGCGADGEPERPDRATTVPGLSVSGTASFGITGGS